MSFGAPTIEERTQGNRPVAFEPRGYQFLAAGSPQVLLISLDIDVTVVIDLGWNEDSFKAGLVIADDTVAQRGRIDVTRLDPLMARPARVSCRSEAYRNPRACPTPSDIRSPCRNPSVCPALSDRVSDAVGRDSVFCGLLGGGYRRTL